MITICFRIVDKAKGTEVSFKMRADQPMKQRMSQYKQRQAQNDVDFFYEGKLLEETDTPETLGIKPDSTVTVRNTTGMNISVVLSVADATQRIQTL